MAIQSESKFILKLIWSIIKLPFTFLLIIFKKKKFKDLHEPIHHLRDFVFETKFTTNIIIINIVLFIIVWTLFGLGIINETFIDRFFVSYPNDLLTFNIIRAVGSWFMHGSVVHLLGNMLFLFVLGRVVEKEFGMKKTALIYFGSAILSTIVNSLIYLFYIGDSIGGLGASGAIAGLASAAMLISPLYLTYLIIGIPLPIFLVSWTFLISDIIGIINPIPGDNVGHFAHLGGFFAITLLILLFDRKDRKRFLKGFVFNLVTLAIVAFIKFY